ncbi:MAG: T9SS type A sorting domain-containing protein [Salinivirgaceae bacterium]
MKKLVLFVFMVIAAFFTKLSAQDTDTAFVEIWAHYGENAPEWFTDGSEVDDGSPAYAAVERGIAYSDYSGHLYVSSRHAEDTDDNGVLDTGEPHVYVLDPLTGEAPAFSVSKLLTTGITSSDQNYGGGYPLNNIVCTEDGSIFACNMTLASGPDIPNENGSVTVKAFRVYRWGWEQDIPTMIINYTEGGYRMGDKFSVIGNWDTEAYIYAAPGESNKVMRWKVTAGIVDAAPEIITLADIANAGTSPTVAGVPGKDDWMYVSGKGFLPTLFTTSGVNLTQVAFSPGLFPSSVLAGRTFEFGGSLYMGMFSGDQSAFVFNISKHGENVTDADVIGFTPTFGTKFDNAYGEGAVDFGVLDNQLHIFVCAPSNGIAAYRIDGIQANSIHREQTSAFKLSAFPNPANDYTKVRFELPQNASGVVSVKVFDLSGRFMGITADRAIGGSQEMEINTAGLPPGTYVYQVVYGNKMGVEKLIIE